MAQSKILDSNINQRSQVGREIINEKNATSFMRKYELFDRADLFPKEIRTMEIKEWESFARQNPYLAKFLNKKLLATSSWHWRHGILLMTRLPPTLWLRQFSLIRLYIGEI